jgi:carboxy-terminal domain RNA polymerase II polypeptide A small phosphatase
MEKTILLILDLDETLIHASREELRADFDFKIWHYFVYKRPFLDDFIRICSKNFTLAVWSSASDDYVEEIVKQIFPADIPLVFVWGRSKCTPIISPNVDLYGYHNMDISTGYEYAKLLKKTKKFGFGLEKTLIVDDTPLKVANAFGNAIYPKMYEGEKDDDELVHLAQYLLTLKDVENVRKIEKRGWQKSVKINGKI